MTQRKDQREQRREQILQTALDLFVRNGYAATKISDIAQAADMSIGLLFHYFDSKENLYKELVTIGLEGTKYPVQREIVSPLDFFEGFLKELFIYTKENPWVGKMFVLMAQAQRNSSMPESIRSIVMQVSTVKLSVAIIEQGQKDGTFRVGNPTTLATTFWASVQGVMEEFAAHPDVPLPPPEWLTSILRPISDNRGNYKQEF